MLAIDNYFAAQSFELVWVFWTEDLNSGMPAILILQYSFLFCISITQDGIVTSVQGGKYREALFVSVELQRHILRAPA